jgi:uncharacterized protein YecT (DUF1311 family)
LRKADLELNRVYQAAIARIRDSDLPEKVNSQHLEQQRAAQRARIKFRDEDSKADGYMWYGGSGAGAAETSWKMRLTKSRIRELRDRYGLHENEGEGEPEPASAADR